MRHRIAALENDVQQLQLGPYPREPRVAGKPILQVREEFVEYLQQCMPFVHSDAEKKKLQWQIGDTQ